MSDARDYLLTVDRDKSAALRIAEHTAVELQSKKLTLIDVVQTLGEYINDEDVTIRSKAVNYFAQVIGALPPTFLSRQQIQVLCHFFCDRIEDGGAVGALHRLQTLKRFNQEMAIVTLRAILGKFHDLQLRAQSQRLQILELLNGLMSNHRPAVLSLGNESLLGIVEVVSGEKDPRNLMIIFSILKVVMVEWDVVGHAETLFDSVFCYFPITFRPPPDNPYGITAQDLKKRLRECIAASRYFAPYAFPQLIDKLDSTSPVVKKDVIQTIVACATTYDVTTMSNYSITLWDSLKYEILNVQEEDLADEALSALKSIAVRLSYGLTSTDSITPLATYLRAITEECNELLKAPQHKQAKPAGQILSSLGTASPPALFLVVKSVIPPMLTLYQDAETTMKKRALLDVLAKLLESAQIMYGSASLSEVGAGKNPLEPFKDRFFEIFSQALMGTSQEEVSFRVVAMRCLLYLCYLRKYLQDNEIGMIIQYLNEILLGEDNQARDELKSAAIQGLVQISKTKPVLIMDITFPAFMARLPGSSPVDNLDYLTTLEGLARISTERGTSDTLIRRLLNRLDAILQKDGSAEYPKAILSTLHYVLKGRDLVSDSNLGLYYDKVVALITRAVSGVTGHAPITALNDLSTMQVLGNLSTLIVRALDARKQNSVGQQAYTLFCEDISTAPAQFEENLTKSQRSTMILTTYLLAGISRDTPLQYAGDDMEMLLKDVVQLSIKERSSVIKHSLLQQTALLVSKFLRNDQIRFATGILWRPSSGLLDTATFSEDVIRPVFWIAKALVLRHANTDEVLKRLLDLLTDTTHGTIVARGFGLLLAPDEILSKENGAIIRSLAKQKVFNICVPAIASSFRDADLVVKSNYLVALSGILRYISTDILMPEIETLLPLLLQSLDLDDQVVKAATIETLTVVSQETPSALEGHVSSLVSRLLKAAANPRANIPKVRYNALRCLRGFPGKIKESNLLPYRGVVTRGMVIILDDSKRHVRKEAVDCRAAWLNMDQPEAD